MVDLQGKEILRTSPKLIVLMDNVSISLFKRYQNTLKNKRESIPSVSLLGVTVEEAIKELSNSTGISYEIPIVSSIIQFRQVFPLRKIDKVGVVHREFMQEYVSKNKMFCATEKITIINILF